MPNVQFTVTANGKTTQYVTATDRPHFCPPESDMCNCVISKEIGSFVYKTLVCDENYIVASFSEILIDFMHNNDANWVNNNQTVIELSADHWSNKTNNILIIKIKYIN